MANPRMPPSDPPPARPLGTPGKVLPPFRGPSPTKSTPPPNVQSVPISEISAQGIRALGLSPPVQAALSSIQAELAEAYRESFVQMMRTLQVQASMLERIQRTLAILVEHVEPSLAGQLPPAVRVAGDGERPDLASTLVVSDPIGAGFTLSQAALVKALGLTTSDVSVLCKAFKLYNDAACAVVVRSGKRNQITNYHPRAIERFKQLLRSPPQELDAIGKQALARVRRKLGGKLG